MNEFAGSVSIVGAGPGDPELITVRGRDRLVAADVVIHDDLAGDALLAYCRPDCMRIHVGKRCGRHAWTQEQVTALLLNHARSGLRVVRLKGGDPFIFGRGGEELAALAREGIPCEVIPGVTAAAAAGAVAGVPLTHRGLASAVVFVTGHECAGKNRPHVDWAAYARLGATLCIYMGMRNLAGIVEELAAGGMPIDTPVALVSRASWPDQTVRFSTLHEFAAENDGDFATPGLAIIGEVARFPSLVGELAASATAAV